MMRRALVAAGLRDLPRRGGAEARALLLLLAFAVLALAACGDDATSPPRRTGDATPAGGTGTPRQFPNSTPDDRTPYPVPTGILSFDGSIPLPQIPDDAAVYLSLGDSLNWGCCADPQLSSHPRFAAYLSERLNRPVVWVSLAGNGTLQSFLHGDPLNGPQLDQAEDVLQAFRNEGRDVIAITLSIGGNDLLELRTRGCTGGGDPECLQVFTDLAENYPVFMHEVYARLNAVKDPATPILQNNLYDAMDCGRPGDNVSASAIAVQVFNERVASVVSANDAFILDFFVPFAGHACEYISGVDPTYYGYDTMLELTTDAYEALPPEYVDPWVR